MFRKVQRFIKAVAKAWREIYLNDLPPIHDENDSNWV